MFPHSKSNLVLHSDAWREKTILRSREWYRELFSVNQQQRNNAIEMNVPSTITTILWWCLTLFSVTDFRSEKIAIPLAVFTKHPKTKSWVKRKEKKKGQKKQGQS